MNGTITIRRPEEDLWREQAVFVYGLKRQSFALDPRRELANASGYWLERTGCVVSLADGFQSAGYPVMIERKWCGGYYTRPHLNPYPTILVYWLLGFSLGHNKWDALKSQIQRIPHEYRLKVFEENAQYLYKNPRAPLELTVSIGLLFP